MDSALFVHRLHFAFTITFHYLFPQLTMGLAPLIVVLKTLALRNPDDTYHQAARFWARIFGINFVLGVVTGIPMEFQFGTNWSHFSRIAGGVIGQTLAMEGMFAFFLESAFLGLFLYGEKRLSPRAHWWSAVAVLLGSWLSGFFIIATDAWMQHPVGYSQAADGSVQLSSFWALVLNPWAWWQYAHNMSGAVITGAFVMASVGAFYLLWGKFVEFGRIFVKVGVVAGLLFSVLQLFPTGDGQGRMIAYHQPVTLAAMEALFATQPGAPLVLVGQPNVDEKKIDNPLIIPSALSFLTYRAWKAEVKGLDAFPQDVWPTSVALLYYSYHIMVGLGTLFIAVMVIAAFLLWRGKLFESRPDVVDFAARPTIPLHRQHRWLDHRRARASALAGVPVDAHGGWILKNRFGWKRDVHASRIHGNVHRFGHLVPFPDAP
jgi:cytochrome bd ubiquinol oxidase subunit I